jgi:hypothetical protein
MSKYILALQNTHKKMKINVKGKSYLIYSNTLHECNNKPDDDFRLKEKLYILSYPIDVVWVAICDPYFDILKTFNNMATPKQFRINLLNRKVLPQIIKNLG